MSKWPKTEWKATQWVGWTYRPSKGKGPADRVVVEARLTRNDWGLELGLVGMMYWYGKCQAAGQCQEELAATLLHDERAGLLAPWDETAVMRLRDIWRDWHLNGMRAGCVHQRALGWHNCPGHYDPEGLETCSKPRQVAVDVDRLNADLRRDGVAMVRGYGRHYYCAEDKLSQPCPECGYKFGTRWLHETLPSGVLRWLRQWFFAGAEMPEEMVAA